MKQTIALSIQWKSPYFFVEGFESNHSTVVLPDEFIRQLACQHAASFYGLQIQQNKQQIILNMTEAFDLLSFEPHAFLRLEGMTLDDQKRLQRIQRVSSWLHHQPTWQALTVDEATHQFQLQVQEADQEEQEMIQAFLDTQFAVLQSQPSEAIVSYLRQEGLKLFEQPDLPITVSLRLTEPEEEDDHWLLETVIVAENGNHWTPAQTKKNQPIEKAIVKKWAEYAQEIETVQQQLLRLTSTISVDTCPTFFYASLNEKQVQQFLKEDIGLLKAFGFEVILPAWLKQLTETKITARAEATTSYKKTATFDDIVAFNWEFALGDVKIDRTTFEQIVADNRSLIQIQNEWFHIDDASLAKLKAMIEEAEAREWTVRDLLVEQATDESKAPALFMDEGDHPVLTFELNRQLKQFVQVFREKKEIPHVPVSEQLQATLRPYQQEGLDWLLFMRHYRFGACLADDMGLGKTIQMISYLLHIHEEKIAPSLVICPTSVLGNWQKELAQFAPSLQVHVHYGNAREEETIESIVATENPQVILTTYGTATQDSELLQNFNFSAVTLDEAQNIKNMQTKQSRAIRNLQADHFIALTGTPIENRLSELWSIFDFMFRGYFGSFNTFTKEYIVPIERDDDEKTKERLRLKIEPFLLRRTKRDESLLLDLPEKVEQNEYCALTQEQAALYESYVQTQKEKMTVASAFEKKGIVLGMLNRLKQLCNHPALYLKEPFVDSDDLLSRSIKFEKIVERAVEITENNEQCLIFTQYIGMGEMLQYVLAEKYDIDVPFLTGAMRKEERDALVDSFQNGEFPIFILSLRAGGTGLNLTAANYVLHADRWWNPAVENQATDRAYRIGQTKFVHVTKYVTLGTIEEKIDKMLQEKMELSDELIQSSRWITELSDEELESLFSV